MSGRCSLLIPDPHQGKDKGGKVRETYKLNIKSFTNSTKKTNNVSNKRNNIKYTKPILNFLELGAERWYPISSYQAAPGSPKLDSTVGRNWTQECTDQNLDRDRRQDREQGLLQKAAMDEESKTLVIPQL